MDEVKIPIDTYLHFVLAEPDFQIRNISYFRYLLVQIKLITLKDLHGFVVYAIKV